MRPLVIGTRGSKLALIQTDEVVAQLKNVHPQREFAVKTIRTGGDKSADAPLASLGLGIFVKEIEEALLRGDIDMAVHSLKDLTPLLPAVWRKVTSWTTPSWPPSSPKPEGRSRPEVFKSHQTDGSSI